MVLWNKPAVDIPTGWQEVIDWRGRMPVGFDNVQSEFNVMGKTGGQKNKTLSIAEMPSHTHDIDLVDETGSGAPAGGNPAGVSNGTGKTKSQGGGVPFSIMNPYRVVMFIEYIG